MYQFTSSQIEDLKALLGRPWESEKTREELYLGLLSTLEQPDALGTSGGHEAEQVRLWLRGAAQANSRQGLFSELIRRYTSTQAELRGLASVSDDLMQLASNAVADRLRQTLSTGLDNYGFTMPTLSEIGVEDATAVGKTIFIELGTNDSAYKNNSAWSGTLLFSMLGGDEVGRLVGTGNNTTLDTFGDFRDLLYAVQAFEQTVGNGLQLALASYPNLSPAIVSALSTLTLSSGVSAATAFIASLDSSVQEDAAALVTDLGILHDTVVLWKGSTAQAALDTLSGLWGNGSVAGSLLAMIFEGTPVASWFSHVQSVGIDGVLAGLGRLTNTEGLSLQGLSTEAFSRTAEVRWLPELSQTQLAELAKLDASVLAALDSLSFLSVGSLDQVRSSSNVSDSWVSDRSAMLLAMAHGDSGGLNLYVDNVLGISTLGPSLAGPPRHVVFGATVDDATNGVDVLYGQDGQAVVLDGGKGLDFLYGGAGNDWLGFTAAGLDNVSVEERDSDGNVYDGGTGNDRISGSTNKDVYIFRRGEGSDYVLTHGGTDDLQLIFDEDRSSGIPTEITQGQVSFKREGLDLLVCINRDDGTVSDQVRIAAWFDSGVSANALGSVTLRSDVEGTVFRTWTKEEIESIALNAIGSEQGDTLTGLNHYRNVLQGLGGNDILIGANGSVSSTNLGDTFIGGANNDQMTGTGSGDTYLYYRGDGHDTITEQNDSTEFEDNLRFVDLHLDEVAFARTGNDLKVLTPSNGSVTVKDWFTPGQDRKIEFISFQNTTLSAQEVESRLASIVLTNNNDSYTATPGNDTVYGLDGDDTLNGGSGSDTLYGGNGADALWGGPGDTTDYLYGQEGIDRLYGEGGDDIMVGGNGTDFLDGGAGSDQLWGSAENDELWGQAGNDTLYGEGGSDKLYGGAGNDTLYGGEEGDLLAGGADNDILVGNAGSDQLWGGAGIDLLYGEAGDDSLYGEADSDLLAGGSGRNILVGGDGDDTFIATGSRDEMHGGAGFDTYLLTPVGQAGVKLIFEDASGGLIDLSQYAQSGIGLNLSRNSQDQLILTRQSGGGETIVINGWSHQTLTLDLGGDVWDYARVQQSLDAGYGYTYDNVYSASSFSAVISGLSYTFNKAVNQYGETEINAAFTTGLTHGVATGISYQGATVYRWGWKAGTLSDQAIQEGAYYANTVNTLIENNRTRSSANIYVVPGVTDPHPVDRVDLWYDFWQSNSGEWQFAVVEAYSAEATTATLNPDGTITPSTEYNKVINEQDPATWELVRPARNNFELLAEQAISANFATQSAPGEVDIFAEPAAKEEGDFLLKAQPLLGALSGQEVVLQDDFTIRPMPLFGDLPEPSTTGSNADELWLSAQPVTVEELPGLEPAWENSLMKAMPVNYEMELSPPESLESTDMLIRVQPIAVTDLVAPMPTHSLMLMSDLPRQAA